MSKWDCPAGVNPANLGKLLGCLASLPSVSAKELKKAAGFKNEASLGNYIAYFLQLGLICQLDDGQYAFAPNAATAFGADYLSRLGAYRAEKQAIAKYVVGHVPPGSEKGIAGGTEVLLDAGSTALCIALALSERSARPRRVATNNLHAALEVLGHVPEVRLIGGFIDRRYAADTAVARPDAIAEQRPDLTVLAASCLSENAGIGCADANQHEVKLAIAQAGVAAKSLVIVADHSKFFPPPQPIPSIFLPDQPSESKVWQSVLRTASLVTTTFESAAGAAPSLVGDYVNNMEYFRKHFGERLVVLRPDGKPLANVRQYLGRLQKPVTARRETRAKKRR